MITLTEIDWTGPGRPIEGYGPGFFRVGGAVFRGAILVTPGGVRPWAGLADADSLLSLAGQVDVILLGMGGDVVWPERALRDRIEAAGLVVEPMSSPSAARTYNVLLSEGRRIAAALLPV
ncbi:MAG TPA: Mth938-like domain-containing protein [Paracoccaceae bacterium]|nr:Mth938-like domain-containing protein [Paracoccaceae bacterium]